MPPNSGNWKLETDNCLLRIRIVLVQPQHPGNIGAAARAMYTMGLARLVLVRPRQFPDVEATRRAVGAECVLERAEVVDRLEEALKDCVWSVASSARPRHLGDEPLPPAAAAEHLLLAGQGGDVALVFGAERTGLSNEEIELCQAQTLVPTNPDYGSLNLASAVQIYAWELRKAAVTPPQFSLKKDHPWYLPATHEQLEMFFEHLERAALATGFLDPANPRLLMRRLRQLFNRAQPDRNELNLLRGLLTTVETPKRRGPRTPPPSADSP